MAATKKTAKPTKRTKMPTTKRAKTPAKKAARKSVAGMPVTATLAALEKIPKTDKHIAKLNALADAAGKSFVTAAEQTDLLTRAIANRAMAVVDLLLAAGVHPDARPSRPEDLKDVFDTPGALIAAALSTKLSASQRRALIDRLLAAGATVDLLHPDLRHINPDFRDSCITVVDVAAATGDAMLVRTLVPRVRDKSILPSATAAVFRRGFRDLYRLPDPDLTAADLRALLAAGLPAAGVSRCGLAIAHAAVLGAEPPVFDVMLEADPKLANAKLGRDRVMSLPISNEKLTLGKGATPLGAAQALLDACRRRAQDPKEVPFLKPTIERLEANIARLSSLGAKADRGTVKLAPAIQPLYEALCAWAGTPAADEQLARIDAKTTPYLFMLRMAKHLPTVIEKLAPVAADNVLAYLLDPKNDHPIEHAEELEGLDYAERGNVRAIYSEDYAEAGQKILNKGGRLITMRGDAVLTTSGLNGGDIWEIDTERAINHGSVEALVADLRARIG